MTMQTQSDISWTSLLHYLPKRSDQLPAPKEGVVQVYHHQVRRKFSIKFVSQGWKKKKTGTKEKLFFF